MKASKAKKDCRIFIASDHAGYNLKDFLFKKLATLGYEVTDLGCESSSKSVDYPDYAQIMSQKIGEKDYGILICGSGIGISIAANRFKNIRAALCGEVVLSKLAREHNNANVVCLGARFLSNRKAFLIVESFFNSEFEGGRHVGRVEKLGK